MKKQPQSAQQRFGTTSSSYLSNTFEALVKLGCPAYLLLEKIPGGHQSLENPSKRFDSTVVIDLLHYAEEVSGTIGIGALAGRFFRPSAMADLGHAMVASSTLEEMIKMYRIYMPLFLQIGQTDIHKEGDRAFVSWETQSEDWAYLRPYVERFFGGVAAFGRWVTWDDDMEILSMSFCHSKPADMTVYNDIFRCPIQFDADQNVMEVPRALVEHTMPQPNPALVKSIRRVLDRDLAALNKPVSTDREVFMIIRSLLPSEAPNIMRVAETMGTTERTLRRRLKDEGTTYRDVLEDVRREVCEFELDRGTHSIADLAQALGYSEQSAFTRAFKEWFGIPPSKYVETRKTNPAPSSTDK